MEKWVGEIDSELVVFDESLQLYESPYVKLWSYSDRDVSAYDKDMARAGAKTVRDPKILKKVIDQYLSWHESNFALYVADQNTLNNTKKGMELAKKQFGRLNFCHSCATPLKAKLTNVCHKCGWIICPNCQSCGCGN